MGRLIPAAVQPLPAVGGEQLPPGGHRRPLLGQRLPFGPLHIEPALAVSIGLDILQVGLQQHRVPVLPGDGLGHPAGDIDLGAVEPLGLPGELLVSVQAAVLLIALPLLRPGLQGCLLYTSTFLIRMMSRKMTMTAITIPAIMRFSPFSAGPGPARRPHLLPQGAFC